VVALVLAYYAVLRSVWRARVELRCRHCGIFFFTHPRNAGRRDLRCPFGCREAHRRRQSDQRSAAYYRDEAGKEKKRALNAKRRQTPTRPAPAVDPLPSAWPRPMLPYLRMVIGLIEGHPVSLAEVVALLGRVLRQHRMVHQRRIEQTVGWWHEEPP
jgi:hypothetical protein